MSLSALSLVRLASTGGKRVFVNNCISQRGLSRCLCVPLRGNIIATATIIDVRLFATKNKKSKQGRKAPAPAVLRTSASSTPPPAFLSATASKHAWISKHAAIELEIDPSRLFSQAVVCLDNNNDRSSTPSNKIGNKKSTPPSFRSSRFEYISPRVLNHVPPKHNRPEVAFLGRSNVGKSSLINALTRHNLARTSKQPGRTQQVNYFGLIKQSKLLSSSGVKNNKNTFDSSEEELFHPSIVTGYLIDLPGYGYAKAPDENVSSWQEKTQEFLLHRRDEYALKMLYLLVDSRTGLTRFDMAVMGWFDEAGISYSIVLTKADRVSKFQTVRNVNDVCMRYHSLAFGDVGGCQGPVVYVTSSKTKDGILELMWAIHDDFIHIEG